MDDRIEFPATLRDRPMVLTGKHVATLSAQAGRDVWPELEEMRADAFPVRTLGQLLRALASALGRAHVPSEGRSS